MIHIILHLFVLLLSYTITSQSHTTSSVNDFCVANLSFPNTPLGYPCKSPLHVTVNDFVFSEFVAGNTKNPFNVGLTTASVNNLPGLNGLGISASRIDIGINGSVPMHFHPDATELFIIVQGRITAGFITPKKVYVKTLIPGDVIVFPKGLVHFQVNSGTGKAIAFAALTSSNPSMDVIDEVLFGNNLSTFMIEKTTLLDPSQIEELKAQFGL